MRIVLVLILVFHGSIHLIGFAKAFGLDNAILINQNLTRFQGILWMLSTFLFIGTAAMVLIRIEAWWILGGFAVALSQYLIINAWRDAKFGTIANMVILLMTGVLVISCRLVNPTSFNEKVKADTAISIKTNSHVLYYAQVQKDVRIKDYFDFMDSLSARSDSCQSINEYILVHSNLWILDSLRATDYYHLMYRGIFLYDQPGKIILHQGDSLAIPDSIAVARIRRKLDSTIVDVNIPEFRLRIFQAGKLLLTCKVRVGRDAEEYLAVAAHIVNLRTPIGVGEIVRVARIPYLDNPETGKRYMITCRDDGKYTKMPVIPWLEPSINGIRYGAMIHPTTNPETLGWAVSHGCIGTTEADAWTIYYNAPVGTKTIFRYDLSVIDEKGDTVRLEDIYKMQRL